MSSAEVEKLLAGMAGVAEVAVVAAPDARYGEHGAAVINCCLARPRSISRPPPASRCGGLARQKWPEELRFVEDFPRTPSGKIQKNVLRAALREPGEHVLPVRECLQPKRRNHRGFQGDGAKLGRVLKFCRRRLKPATCWGGRRCNSRT